MELKITLKSQFFALKEIIIITCIYLIVVCSLYIGLDIRSFQILFFSTFIFYILLVLPVILLHINYLNNHKYKKIIINQDGLVVDGVKYRAIDIIKINVYATSQHFNDSVGGAAAPYNDYYYYLELILNNGRRIYLSSLIDYKIDEIIKNKFTLVEVIEKPSNFIMLFIK